MSILKDEKVVAAIAKESAKATKAETKRALEIVKSVKELAKVIEDKAAKKVVADLFKEVETRLKTAT